MSLVQSIDLLETSDSIEVCPDFPSFACCSTYQLDEETRERHGSLILFELDQEPAPSLAQRHSSPMNGILDSKWSYVPGFLGSATAKGELVVNSLNIDEKRMEPVASCRADDCLCLSLDWSCLNTKQIVSSYSNGGLSVWTLGESSLEPVLHLDNGHEAFGCPVEAWVAAWSRHDPFKFASGGDDAKLKVWDTRNFGKPEAICRHHGSGVTSAAWHPSQPHKVATGSYDDSCCIWDDRDFSKPICSYSVGGGAWRLRWHPSEEGLLAVAAMRGGGHVLSWDSGEGEESVTAAGLGPVVQYMGHGAEALTYGVDWVAKKGNTQYIATCSFYNKQLHLWSVDLLLDGDGATGEE